MPLSGTMYRVMIASPSDVGTERHQVREVIHEWNVIHAVHRQMVLLPVGWETHAAPAMGDRAQAIINERVLQDCDLLVAIFWTRIGTPTGEEEGGTVEEIKRHLDSGKPAMIYFSNEPVRPDSVDDEQYRAVKEFKEWCKERGLIHEYASVGEFRTEFTRHLAQTVLQDPYFGYHASDEEVEISVGATDRGDQGDEDQRLIRSLAEEARTLLLEASEDKSGTVMKIGFIGGFHVQTNGKQFVKDGDARSRAAWEGAVDDLYHKGLLHDPRGKGEVFRITSTGYRIADELRRRFEA